MATTICRNCGNTCEVNFRPYIRDKNGKIVYPKKSKVFPIPQCNCTENPNAA